MKLSIRKSYILKWIPALAVFALFVLALEADAAVDTASAIPVAAVR